MTSNEVAYWQLQETKRSNFVKEGETERSNRAKESLTGQQNVETERHNKQSEYLTSDLNTAQRARWEHQNQTDTINATANVLKGVGSVTTGITKGITSAMLGLG